MSTSVSKTLPCTTDDDVSTATTTTTTTTTTFHLDDDVNDVSVNTNTAHQRMNTSEAADQEGPTDSLELDLLRNPILPVVNSEATTTFVSGGVCSTTVTDLVESMGNLGELTTISRFDLNATIGVMCADCSLDGFYQQQTRFCDDVSVVDRGSNCGITKIHEWLTWRHGKHKPTMNTWEHEHFDSGAATD